MRLDLYAAGVPSTALSNWIEKISVRAETQSIRMVQSPMNEMPEALQERLPVVLDELCAVPEQQISFCGRDEVVLSFAYESYQACFNQGWNVCLSVPSKEAIFLHFDDSLLARKVAHLYYQEGTSDKVYHLYLAHALTVDFYSVISRYGRRGKTLQQTEKSFDYRLEEADKEWNQLHHSKIQKGYQIGRPTAFKQLEFDLPF